MRITYDREVDALYFRFRDTTVTTKHLGEGIASGRIPQRLPAPPGAPYSTAPLALAGRPRRCGRGAGATAASGRRPGTSIRARLSASCLSASLSPSGSTTSASVP